MRTTFAIIIISIASFGCVPEQDALIMGNIAQLAVEAREASISALEALEAAKVTQTEIRAAIDALPPGIGREAWVSRAEATDKALSVLTAVAESTEASAANFEELAAKTGATTLDLVEGGVQVVAPFLPPPWNAVLLGLVSLVPAVGGILHGLKKGREARAVKATAHSVIKAIDREKERDNGKINFIDHMVSERLDVSMGAAGKALVDEAQGKS